MKILRTTLQIFGMLFLAAVVAAVGMYFYAFHTSTEKVNQATENQARFVLNWGGLNAKQNYSVVFSHESRNGFLPDHLIYYCLQLSEFPIDEHHREEWKAGPETNPVFSQAIETAAKLYKRQRMLYSTWESELQRSASILLVSSYGW
jgi:hypothetical protein